MLSTLSTLTNDPLSLWEWTVPDEGYCTGSTAPGESQFTNMNRKSRKNAHSVPKLDLLALYSRVAFYMRGYGMLAVRKRVKH